MTPGENPTRHQWLGMTLHGPHLASACLKYLLSIPLHGFLTNGREQALQTADYNTILCIYHSMDKLDKPVSYRVGVTILINFPRMLKNYSFLQLLHY